MTTGAERESERPAIVRKGGWDVTLAQWIHLVGAGLAGGSMFFIIFALLPSVGTLSSDEGGRLMATLLPRARLIFWTAIVFLSLGGLYLTLVGSQIRSFEQLFSTTYGRVLTVKIGLALLVSTLALMLTLPLDFLAGFQTKMPDVLPVVFGLAGLVVLLGAVLRRMRTGTGGV
jgi:uncharacterized membrane protein